MLEKAEAIRLGEDLTVDQFARKYHSIGATTITHAISFAGLPSNIKMMHSYGLLNYSTAVAIAEEIETDEKKLDWAIEASLLGYNAQALRKKVYEAEHQLNFDTYCPGLFGGVATKTRGRNVVVSREIKTALEVIPAIEETSKTSKVPRYMLHSIAEFFNAYEDLQKHFN